MDGQSEEKEGEVKEEMEGEVGPRELAKMNFYLDGLLHELNEILGELRSINHPELNNLP